MSRFLRIEYPDAWYHTSWTVAAGWRRSVWIPLVIRQLWGYC